MGKYEEWHDYEDYDDEYEDKKSIYKLVYYKNGEEENFKCYDFDDALFTMSCYNICDRVKVIDRRDESDVTEEFTKFLREKDYVFKDEAEKEIPVSVYNCLPDMSDFEYCCYDERNFLKLYSLNKILNDEKGRVLWKYRYFMFAYGTKLEGFEYSTLLFIDRALEDSPVYAAFSCMVDEEASKEDILSYTKCISPSFSAFYEKLERISDEEFYNISNSFKTKKTPAEEQKEKEQKEAEERAMEEECRGEKLDYVIEDIEYAGESFELLKFNYHNKEFVYSTVELGAKIAEAGDIGSDFEKSIIEFLEEEEFDGLKDEIAEEPYWNRFMEYCNDCYIRNDTVFYGGGDFMFRHNGKHFSKIRLSYDHTMFGYVLADPDYSEDALKQIANDNRCNEVLDEERFYKMEEFMDKAHRHSEEFTQFCAENNIPNVIEEHEVDRDFDFSEYIDDEDTDEE